MAKKTSIAKRQQPVTPKPKDRSFHLEFKNPTQKTAWTSFQENQILFLLGPAGTGKTFLSVAFAINEILAKRKERIILTRPIVEAGESLGFLPGIFEEKVSPYMIPLIDSITKLVGPTGSSLREIINQSIEIRPLAYLRGSNLDNAICLFDEAQNATRSQLKMYLTRLGENSKMIISGDPCQSDLPGPVALVDVVDRLKSVEHIGTVTFDSSMIVRNPLITKILAELDR